MSLYHVGENILLVSWFALAFIAPGLMSVADIILIPLKLFGCIKWSWAVVIFGPMLIEVLPIAACAIGFSLTMLAPSVQNKQRNPAPNAP